MTLALTFVSAWLLIGLAAAGIPFVLHLLSSVKAQEVYFPTLRFLKVSMEKTARRRRIQHWLLLLLRSVLLALLAVAAAQPISQATGGWFAGRDFAAAVILDNSYSMAGRGKSGSRFSRAKSQASSLLAGQRKPAMAAVLMTNGGDTPAELTGRLDDLRGQVDAATISFAPSQLAQRVTSAIELLANDASPQKSIYIFTDLQRASLAPLANLPALARASDIHLLIVDTSTGKTNSVGISDLEITGRRIVNQPLEITATLVNSAQSDRVVDVLLRVEGQEDVQRVRKSLRPCGREGSAAAVRFYHAFSRPGEVSGQITVEAADDDLPLDNSRAFALAIAPQVRALVVAGPSKAAEAPSMQSAHMLSAALEPFGSGEVPWSVASRTIAAAAFGPDDLDDIDAVFFCNVPSFTADQARAVTRFVRDGGTSVFFPGPDTDAANYNLRFINETGSVALLAGKLKAAVGQVGPAADAVPLDWVDMGSPYLAGLLPTMDDYLTVLVQRYFELDPSMRHGGVIMRLSNSAPLLLARTFGRGKSILCTTTASPRWSDLPVSGLFLPVMNRICVLARPEAGADNTHLAGSQVSLRPNARALAGDDLPQGAQLSIVKPGASENDAPAVVPLRRTDEGPVATFSDTAGLGVYRWKLSAGPQAAVLQEGSFVVNPHGQESRLEPIKAQSLVAALKKKDVNRVYIAGSLEAVNQAALADTEGRNWWDVLLVGVILLLITESVVANRRKSAQDDMVPAGLVSPRPAAPTSSGAQ